MVGVLVLVYASLGANGAVVAAGVGRVADREPPLRLVPQSPAGWHVGRIALPALHRANLVVQVGGNTDGVAVDVVDVADDVPGSYVRVFVGRSGKVDVQGCAHLVVRAGDVGCLPGACHVGPQGRGRGQTNDIGCCAAVEHDVHVAVDVNVLVNG